MEKISLKNLNLNKVEKLTKEELKAVLGGFNGSGSGTDPGAGGSGGCVRCTVTSGPNSGATSCYYTTSTPNELCSRVYPNVTDTGMAERVTCTTDCIMN